jgi:hypothetical protein
MINFSVWRKCGAPSIALLGIIFLISGCQTPPPFEQAFCTAARNSSPPCLPSIPSIAQQPATLQQPQQATAPTPTTICPDSPRVPLYSLDITSKGWMLTPCERVIVAGALTHCTQVTGRTDIFNDALSDLSLGTNISSTVVGGIVSVIGGAKAIPAVWIAGAVTALPGIASGLKGLVSGTPPIPAPAAMLAAATSYASIYESVEAPANNDTGYLFYAGLWNAAGSACPQNLFLGNFKMWPIDLTQMSRPENFQLAPPAPASPPPPSPSSATPTQTAGSKPR